nr:hypothetical protein [Candidatus Sigynarchaeota archaeon]
MKKAPTLPGLNKEEETITIIINEDGVITADAEDFTGDICLKELQKLLEGFPGFEETDRKPEFYKKDPLVGHKTVTKQK